MRRSSTCGAAVVAVAFAIAPVLGPAQANVSGDPPRKARAAGDDNPWPRTNRLRPHVRAARRELNRLERSVALMELSVARYDDWESCLRYVPVSEYGDPWEHRYGYLYEAREGTGAGPMDALAIDRRSRPRKEHYMFIDFDRSRCRSQQPQPGGTADPASVRPTPPPLPGPAVARPLSLQLPAPGTAERVERPSRRANPPSASASARRGGLKRQVRRLTRRAKRLFRRAQVLEAASERFDEWESCVSWIPVTQQGGEDLKFGYLFGAVGQWPGFRPALHVDRSDWDDPDYMFLGLVGGDRPGGSCQDEPGEAVD